MTIPAPTLRPGDPPPFWDGPWHPEGKTEGAIHVKPLAPGAAWTHPAFAMGATATATIPAAPAAPAAEHEVSTAIAGAIPAAPPQAPAAAETVPPAQPIAMPAPPQSEPIAAGPAPQAPASEPIQMGAPSAPPQQPPQQQAPQQQAQPGAQQAGTGPLRSFVGSLLAQGPISAVTSFPSATDPDGAAQLRAKSKELQAANQLGPALQALTEALKRAPADAATYAQMGSLLLAGRAWEDAAHHFLLAYMLAPKEAAYSRMTLHTAWVLGYVGWAFQIAQGLYRVQPTPDLAEMGRLAQGWLASRAPAYTSLCPQCRSTALVAGPGPCAKCGANTLGGPANAIGFQGIRLMQQNPPNGRLLAGAACANCMQDTVLLVTRGGPRCQHCQEPPLPTL